MEKIISIVEEYFLETERVQITVRKNKIIISQNLFYCIVLNPDNSDKINIYPIWKVGLIGKFFFPKVYKDQIKNYKGLKNHLLNNGFELSELHIIGNFA
jgi:hypothetical protein